VASSARGPIRRGPRGPGRPRSLVAPGASAAPTVANARATAAAKQERQVAAVVELDLDKCQNVFGDAASGGRCTATGTQCFNTFATCKDKPNYNRGIYTWRFCSSGMPLPPGEAAMRPYIKSVAMAPTEIDPAKGLAVRSHTVITMADEPCPDTEADPYIASRASPAAGTFWRRLSARTKNAAGRFARVRRGFVQSPWSWDTFQTELYLIESLTGPDKAGQFTVELADVVRQLDRVQIPLATDGKLLLQLDGASVSGFALAGTANTVQLPVAASQVDGTYVGSEVFILAGLGAGQRRVISGYVGSTRIATVSVAWTTAPDVTSSIEVAPLSLTLDAGKGAQYPDPSLTGTLEYVRIGDEVIRFAKRAGDVLSWTDGSFRAQFGTTRASQNAGGAVQLSRAYNGASVTAVITDIVRSGVDAGYIDSAGLADQDATWFGTAAAITACVTSPTKASDLLQDLLVDLNMLAWWDPVGQLVRFKANMPELPSTIVELTDDSLIRGETIVDVVDSDRLTRLAIWYGLRAATLNLTEAKNFARGALRVDTDAESVNEYGDVRPNVRYSRWLSSANINFTLATAARRLGGLRDAPLELTFKLDPRDDVNVGDLRQITSRARVDQNGNPSTILARVVKRADRLTHLEIDARSTNLGQRFAFIAPAGFPDYDVASTAQRAFAFISNSNGTFNDGSGAYLIA